MFVYKVILRENWKQKVIKRFYGISGPGFVSWDIDKKF